MQRIILNPSIVGNSFNFMLEVLEGFRRTVLQNHRSQPRYVNEAANQHR
jgi:hypothetical protein